MHFPAEKCGFGGGHMAGTHRTLQEGVRAQESSERQPSFTRRNPLRSALKRLLCWWGSQLGIYRKSGFSPLGSVHETVLGHLLRLCTQYIPFFLWGGGGGAHLLPPEFALSIFETKFLSLRMFFSVF